MKELRPLPKVSGRISVLVQENLISKPKLFMMLCYYVLTRKGPGVITSTLLSAGANPGERSLECAPHRFIE